MRAKRHPYRFILARAWMDPTLPSACSHPSFEWQAAPHIGFSPKVTNLGLVPPEEIERDAFEVDQDQFGIYVLSRVGSDRLYCLWVTEIESGGGGEAGDRVGRDDSDI
uniref:Uncharacterized protein n=1 Tax=Haptolina ericina TaxID=156174 RepID=A0A7S3ARW4_9EUKA|mmetsp:Transcript_3246/g.7061  ORF Transcript_3246/g.7061 Transcript_3246/m.7061 type:complete len:108 (+) Transcript_3246:493-816(+)